MPISYFFKLYIRRRC